MLREHLKRSLANSQKYQKQMTEYRQEILQLGDYNKKLETVVSKKNLLGRERLTQQLQLATNLVKEKDNKIAVSKISISAYSLPPLCLHQGWIQTFKPIPPPLDLPLHVHNYVHTCRHMSHKMFRNWSVDWNWPISIM